MSKYLGNYEPKLMTLLKQWLQRTPAGCAQGATAEGWQMLSSHRVALEILQSEKSPIVQDHKEGSRLQNHALQTLQERLHEADATLKKAGELQPDAE